MQITYEAATRWDIPVLFRLAKDLIDRCEILENIDYQKVLAWVQRKLEAQIQGYERILCDGVHAGYVHVIPGEECTELDDLFVFPEHQGRGIGTEVIRRCIRGSCPPVMLYVFIRNEGAIRLYRRLGFRVTETVHGSRYIMLYEK